MVSINSQSKASPKVAFIHCKNYNRECIASHIDTMVNACATTKWGKKQLYGKHILLKPNLVSGNGFNADLATSAPDFVAGVALWCKEMGATVSLGDSPAFGSAVGVCKRNGIIEVVADLDIKIVEFTTPLAMILSGGREITIAAEALECDILLNLPRIKAHSQMYMTLAVKNLFGCVKGADKAWLHMKEGGGEKGHSRFAQIITQLHELLAEKVTLFHVIDGITAMHKTGPMNGTAINLGLLAASESAVALDTAILSLLQLEKQHSPLWREMFRQNHVGCRSEDISYPLQTPEDFSLPQFIPPDCLAPVRFNPFHYLKSSLRRFFAKGHKEKSA